MRLILLPGGNNEARSLDGLLCSLNRRGVRHRRQGDRAAKIRLWLKGLWRVPGHRIRPWLGPLFSPHSLILHPIGEVGGDALSNNRRNRAAHLQSR